jgi:hypothetical protein
LRQVGAMSDTAFTMSNSTRLRAGRFRLRWSFGGQVGGQAAIIPRSAPPVLFFDNDVNSGVCSEIYHGKWAGSVDPVYAEFAY